MEKEQLTKMVAGRITGLKRLMVISKKEGKLLGKVSHIYLNPEKKKLSGIVIKDEFWSREKFYFSMKDVESVGEDVILINSENSCKKVLDDSDIVGVSLEELKGHGVITDDGKDLGRFKDANFQAKTWEISEIFMSSGQCLKVEVSKITIGEDDVVVPASYAMNIEKAVESKKGLLYRFLMEEKDEDSKGIIH
jgi:uncharacterized protein YrrD